MRFWSVLIGVFVSVAIYSSVTLQHGIVGLTKLNGEGCICHNLTPTKSVTISISGQDSIPAGGIALFKIRMTGAPGVVGGMNVASLFGTLSPFDTTARIIDGEITHSKPKLFVSDTVEWKFYYQAPVNLGWDTIYATGLSANQDSIPTSDDKWNFSPNFPVKIVQFVPVEMASFSCLADNNNIIIEWITSSEVNNSGFRLFRIENNRETFLSFLPGKGNSAERNYYNFTDNPQKDGSYSYRLEQVDYNGTIKSYFTGEVYFSKGSSPLSLNNNPNPFSEETKISFHLPENGNISLDIFNNSGELIQEVVSGYFSSGKHEINWNADKLPGGVYYCRLSLGNEQDHNSKKIIKLVILK